MDSVQLSNNFGTYEEEKAFAFLYTVVPTVAAGIFDPSGVYGTVKSPGYITVPTAGAPTVDVPLRLDDDYNFKLLAIRYIGLMPFAVNGTTGYTSYYKVGLQNSSSSMLDEKQNYPGQPVTSFLNVKVSLDGLGGRILYGSTNASATTMTINHTSSSTFLNNISNMQGGEYGFITLRTPALLPRSSMVTFSFVSSIIAAGVTANIYVNAVMYGMKVRV
jgi:hypothetical protein